MSITIRLHSGYILDGVRESLGASHGGPAFDAEDALRFLTEFEATGLEERPSRPDPMYAVAANLVARGGARPTRASCELEDAFADRLRRTQRTEDRLGAIRYPLDADDEFGMLLRQALAVVDPRLQPAVLRREVVSWERHDSRAEARFAYEVAPALLGHYALQVLDAQRLFDTIVGEVPPKLPSGVAARFRFQRVDFAVQFPARTDGERHTGKLVVEIDGLQHEEPVQRQVDGLRNNRALRAGWETLRIKTNELAALPSAKRRTLEAFFKHPYARALAENYDSPLWETTDGQAALDLALAPFGIARVQRVLLHLALTGALDPDADVWRVAVVERDVPCAALAVDDLGRLLGHLLALEGQDRRPPRIELAVYNTPEFAGSPLADPARTRLFTGADGIESADVLLDVSVLQRAGLTEPVARPGVPTVSVRSAHAPVTTPRFQFHSADRVRYAVPDEEQPEAMRFFLRTVFRKAHFREGQVPVLRRALAGQDVVALLPTGAGKSLTYQLAALLQPGVTVVVAPIKSLMRDQHTSLGLNGIGAVAVVNSSLTPKEKTRAIQQMTEGAFLFVAVSPERFQSDPFRAALAGMRAAGEPRFAYGIVDEAHCVSEWGHDFRTAYLRLAANLRAHCPPLGDRLPLLALTGTASYDVLDDVKRELEVDDGAVVRLAKMERKELAFRVVRVDVPGLGGMSDRWDASEEVAVQKHRALLGEVASLPTLFDPARADLAALLRPDEGPPGAGIVFAPHAGQATEKGHRSPLGTEVIGGLLAKLDGLKGMVDTKSA